MRNLEPDPRSSDGNTAVGDRGQMLLDISNSVVKIHKQFYGKGPTKARAHLSQDLLTVLLEGGFTRSEQTLRDGGHDRALADSRHAMHQSVEAAITAAVEAITGRRVRSFMSAIDPDQEVQVEVFVLSRDDDEPDSHNGHRPVLDEQAIRRLQRDGR